MRKSFQTVSLRLSEKVLRSVLITKLASTQHQNQVVFVPFLDL